MRNFEIKKNPQFHHAKYYQINNAKMKVSAY